MLNTNKKGFTLVELMIVIAILAILGTVVVSVLNPAELLAQARDSQRISDLAALNGALALYLSDVSSPSLGVCSATTANCTAAASASGLVTRTVCTSSNSRAINGTGWVDVNFTSISSGSPLPTEPIDPVNSTSLFYSYGCDNSALKYEIDARMESNKYRNIGNSDGGDTSSVYEVGTNLTL
jgi:prepilin-type N-terminal cleavage/methylation domain-containing protein